MRRKSFEDLHRIWYLCLKERNIIATEIENAVNRTAGFALKKQHMKRKRVLSESMCNIKFVLNERMRSFEEATSAKRKQERILNQRNVNDDNTNSEEDKSVLPADITEEKISN